MSETLYVPYTTTFLPPSEAFPKGELRANPFLKAHLTYQQQRLPFVFPAIVDSGADHCAFPALMGRRIGIPVEQGRRLPVLGAVGIGLAYFHHVEVTVQIQDRLYPFACYGGFMTSLDEIGVGLLGRQGFFDLFERVSFNENARVIEFSLRESV